MNSIGKNLKTIPDLRGLLFGSGTHDRERGQVHLCLVSTISNSCVKEVFYGTSKKAATPKKPNYRLNLTKITQFSRIRQ